MSQRRLASSFVALFVFAAVHPALAQAPAAQAPAPRERVDLEVVAKIKEEGMNRSRVMETLSYLTDVHGPRLTGSPQIKKASGWAVSKMSEWGLENAHLEAWGPFGRGWSLEGFTANMTDPSFSSLIAYPKAWSPSTPDMISGEPIYLDAANDEELEKFKGKLKGAIVLMAPARDVKAWFEAPGQRTTDDKLLTLANADLTAPGGAGPGGPAGRNAAQMSPEQRAALQMQGKKWQLLYEEGAAVVLEPGRGDGGTVFVQSVTMPVPPGTQAPAAFARGPRPWAKDAPVAIPQVVVAAEHYNRIIRTIKKGTPVKLQVAIKARFYDDDLMSHNVVAEIPGTDLKDEVVMLGGHFDSWHSGTGATDNAAGSSVAMEVVRILRALDIKPRRTIRIALWTGEEEGLLGSRAYVTDHFGRRLDTPGFGPGGNRPTAGTGGATEEPPAAGTGSANESQRGQRPAGGKYELKPEHEKFAAYFNLDNGTGKIRGVHLQGNEACRPIFRAWLAPFKDMGASTLTISNTGGTDHLSFDGVGLPGFQFIQDPIEYDTRTHHSNMDVYDRIQEDDMKQASVIMASFVYNAAMRDEKLPRKALLGEVVKP
jgi:carboxypeptidase Q